MALWAMPVWVLLAACAGMGTVMVSYAIKAEVAMRDGSGRTQERGFIVSLPRNPALDMEKFPFDGVRYRGQDFEWTFGSGLGGSIANRSAKLLCLRFDQAQVSSNFHPDPRPLRIHTWHLFREKWSRIGSTDPRQPQFFGPPSLCVEPGKAVTLGMGLDLKALFPTGKMFNVSWPGNEPQLADNGAGNWIAMSLPVEIGEERLAMDVKLTATDSKAFISFH